MRGTDLGIAFASGERIALLFGDTLASDPELQDVDLAAAAPRALPHDGLPRLEWLGPLAPPGLPLPRMGVPTDGLTIGGDTLVFFATRFDDRSRTYATSALARTTGLAFGDLELVSESSAGDFAHVTVIVHEGEAFVFGTGAYRRSAIRLARVPVADLADRRAWRIAPEPVADVRCAGEISARRHPTLPLFLLTYVSSEPRGVTLLVADHPAGPWRSAGLLFDPADGYGQVMHQKESAVGHDDGLSDEGEEETWGGEYGAYLVPDWSSDDALVLTLSSWNPYQVHLLRAHRGARPAPPAGLPPPRIASDGTFVVGPATQALTFTLRGRRGHVSLWRGEERIRCSRAPGFFRTRHARLRLDAYRGETLRVEVAGADARRLALL